MTETITTETNTDHDRDDRTVLYVLPDIPCTDVIGRHLLSNFILMKLKFSQLSEVFKLAFIIIPNDNDIKVWFLVLPKKGPFKPV